jgi:hypothetical protein
MAPNVFNAKRAAERFTGQPRPDAYRNEQSANQVRPPTSLGLSLRRLKRGRPDPKPLERQIHDDPVADMRNYPPEWNQEKQD